MSNSPSNDSAVTGVQHPVENTATGGRGAASPPPPNVYTELEQLANWLENPHEPCADRSNPHRIAATIRGIVAAGVSVSSPRLDDFKALYFDLLLQVGNKHPEETRHQTAKRYIREAEYRGDIRTQVASSSASPTGDTP